MKVLSLKQPFAELVVSGRKTIELRKWMTKFRGEFLVHASKNPDIKVMKKFGFKELPLGCIVGKATLVSVKEYNGKPEFSLDKSKHLADTSWGKYGFVLKDACRVDLIYVNGKLNFWEFDLDNKKLKEFYCEKYKSELQKTKQLHKTKIYLSTIGLYNII